MQKVVSDTAHANIASIVYNGRAASLTLFAQVVINNAVVMQNGINSQLPVVQVPESVSPVTVPLNVTLNMVSFAAPPVAGTVGDVIIFIQDESNHTVGSQRFVNVYQFVAAGGGGGGGGTPQVTAVNVTFS